ncbi:MAG: response regulator, partial [Desulfobacterales bacterium]|nr:response regulator [Desulfobacterales bacterium]
GKKQTGYLDAIKTAGKSLLTLINDILDLSKIEAGKLEIQYAPINPRMIVAEIEQIFRMKISGKRLRFIVEIDEGLPSALLLDETRLRQILLNLVGNAVKFTEKGHIKIEVKQIENKEDRDKLDLAISVEDTGIGIPEEEHKRIFDSFAQQHGQSTRKFGGTGLGLSICKRLIEMMNGRITVSSAVGRGSVFEITLWDVRLASTAKSREKEKAFHIGSVLFEKANVLVVDDVRSDRKLLAELLNSVNLDVTTATNGREAVDAVQGPEPPDLVLMDIRMPVMNGREAAKRLKADPQIRETPIIAITATMKSRQDGAEMAALFDGYLTKPVKTHELFGEISRYLSYTEKAPPAAPEKGEKTKPLRIEEIENLPGLLKTLREQAAPLWENVKGGGKMGDIRMFGEQLKELAEIHHARILFEYGKGLLDFAKSYDITNINRSLRAFPELMEKLKKKTGDE